jgi:hypothetical protein
VVVHRGRTDEQFGGNFAIGAALGDESSDSSFLWSHRPARLHVALPGLLTSCLQLCASASSKAFCPHLDEHVMSNAQLVSGVPTATLTS